MNIHETASQNILAFLESGRLVQRTWQTERDGKKIACLLGAAGGYNSTDECPAELMPRWLAECTVTLFDGISADDVPKLAKRYGSLVGQWAVISDSGWNIVLSRWIARVTDQAIDAVPAYAKKRSYWLAIQKSTVDCKAAIIAQDKDAAARAARAADYVAFAADYAARGAIIADDKDIARAARAADYIALAAYYAARAADYAADVTDYAAHDIACAADYFACAAAYATDANARAAAYKSLFNGLLDEIEREIGVSSNG